MKDWTTRSEILWLLPFGPDQGKHKRASIQPSVTLYGCILA